MRRPPLKTNSCEYIVSGPRGTNDLFITTASSIFHSPKALLKMKGKVPCLQRIESQRGTVCGTLGMRGDVMGGGRREHVCEVSHEQSELRPSWDFTVGIKDWDAE